MKEIKSALLILHGPLCAGKTTISKHFSQNYSKVFKASTDDIKWQISDYTSKKYKRVISEMMLRMVDVALAEGFFVIGEGLGVDKFPDLLDEYYKVAKKHNILVLELNIEAPYDVLEERFLDRLKRSEESGFKLTVTDVSDMKNRYDTYLKNRNNNLVTLNTDNISIEELERKILDLTNF